MTLREFLVYLEGRNKRLHRLEERSRRVGALLEEIHDGQFLRNVENDDQIGDDRRLKLLKRLCRPLPLDVAEMKDRLQGFCYGNQRKGDPLDGTTTLRFGHVQSRERLEQRLVDDPKTGFVKSTVAPAVSDLLGLPEETQKRRLGGFFFQNHQMFSTYHKEVPAEPFHGVECTRGELRRRLGLGHLPAVEPLVYWSHRLPEGRRAFVPTAFDGELMPSFRLGGRTRPLEGDDDEGLPEAVHRAVGAAHLVSPIREAEVS